MITPEQLALSGSESGHQKALFCWAALNSKIYPQLDKMFAIPNGGFRDKREASNLVAEGARKGVPDLLLAYPCGDDYGYFWSGLFIEMKKEEYRNRKNGGCSDDQILWAERLIAAGYKYRVAYNWIEARNAILNYLGLVQPSTKG